MPGSPDGEVRTGLQAVILAIRTEVRSWRNAAAAKPVYGYSGYSAVAAVSTGPMCLRCTITATGPSSSPS